MLNENSALSSFQDIFKKNVFFLGIFNKPKVFRSTWGNGIFLKKEKNI